MNDAIVSIEGLGKRYRLQHRQDEPYVALRDVLAGVLSAPFRWLTSEERSKAPTMEDFWALEDVTFDVARGEVIGIIGRNGAGKSTLLKILSRITEPTTGRVTLDGRVASLLEVGTGFHPELTGRENVFLNGAILGMTRQEIRRKFESIVAFAEVERFLDTPVKRYSSGMYVRLAFAVAAHLEPEILIVDEVLAVGDAGFQKKSLGKMQEASKGGRTVVFVSHNMAAIASLTTRCVVLNAGRVTFDGPSAGAIEHYTQLSGRAGSAAKSLGKGLHTAITAARLLNAAGDVVQHYVPGTQLRLEITFETDGTSRLSLEAFLVDAVHQKLALASLHQFHGVTLPDRAGRFRTVLELPGLWLASGAYTFDLATSIVNVDWDHYVEDVVDFDVIGSNPGGEAWDFKQSMGYGAFALPCARAPEFVPEPHDGR
jgi:lipopolysaccharide transport system ATP-binding protein